jgi:tRNA(adenine34) deaminase
MSLTPADLDPDERARHEACMALAIDAAAGADAPFGTVIVARGTRDVLRAGRNRSKTSPLLHGEMDALLNGPAVDWTRTALYTTGEPCPMCMSAAIWAGIPEIVYATSIATLTRLGAPQIALDADTVAAAAPFHECRIVGGVLAGRTDALFAAWLA